METQYTRLSMTPSGVPPVIYMSQNDIGRPIGFICDADLSDYSVVLEGTRTDGTPITVAVTVDGNICAFETTATMTNKADVYIVQIVVTNASGKHISSIPIKCVVVLAAMDENSEGIEEDAPLYQQYTGTVQSLIADIRTQLNTEAAARQAADNTLQSNINAEASTRAAADQNLQAQISQIVAPSGEAPSAAEVQNARVGADGVTYPTLGDAIRANDSQLKSHLDAIIVDNYTEETKNASASTADRALSNYGDIAYSAGNTVKEYTVTSGTLIHLNVADRTGETYTVTYAFYSGEVSTATLVGDVHTNELSGVILAVPDGAVRLAISQLTSNTTNYVKRFVPKTTSLENDVSNLTTEVAEIDDYIFSESAIQISSITRINARPGWNASDGSSAIYMSTNASFDTYWFVTNEDIDIWFDEVTAEYLAVMAGGTYTGTEQSGNNFYIYCDGGSVRYRNIDHNLPTESNKLHVPANCPIAFTITAGKMDSVYGAGGKKVSDRFKNEILAGVGNAKEKYLRYVSGSGPNSSTERVEVYLPAASGYVRYDFLHTVSTSLNANVWRIGYAYHVTDSLSEDYALTTTGEWECAVKLDGRSDFSGGYAHGDEVMNGITFIVDGEPVDITTLTEITAFKELSIIEDSTFYDPNDSATAFASHGSEHLFTDDGLTIKQSVNFLLTETVSTMYMAMFPIAKAVSNMVVPNSNYIPLSTDTARRLYNTDGAVIYKTGGKVKADFSVPRFEYLSNGFTFLCLDNGTTEYNKCYFCNALGNASVSAGKLMKSETKYKFAISA